MGQVHQYKKAVNQRARRPASKESGKRLVAQATLNPASGRLILTIAQIGEYIAHLNKNLADLTLVKRDTQMMTQHSRQTGRVVTQTLLTYAMPATDQNTNSLFELARVISQTGTQVFRMKDQATRQHFMDSQQRKRAFQKVQQDNQDRDAPVLPVSDGTPLADTQSIQTTEPVVPVSVNNGKPLADTGKPYSPNTRSRLDGPDITVKTGQNMANRDQATALMIRAARDPDDENRLISGYSNEGLYESVLSHPGARYIKATKQQRGHFRVPISETTPNLIRLLTRRYGLVPESTVPTLGNQTFVQVIKNRLAHLKNTYRLSSMDSLADEKETFGNLPVIPRPDGLNYLPYQEAGIRYAVSLGNALIADEPGLGKTIQAVGVSNAVSEARRILVIPPASLKINWKREWEKWCAKGLTVARVQDGRPESWPPNTDVVILNFDLVEQHHERLNEQPWDMLIVDEAHALKTADTKRTKLILGHGTGKKHVPGIPAKRKLFLTGTPILNRPLEIWPLAHALDPDFFSDKFSFEQRYCDAHKTQFGWNNKGSSNPKELNRQLRARIMVRRQKSQVLKDLPPKTRQLIELDHPALAGHNDAFSKLSAAQESLKGLYGQREALRGDAERGDITFDEYVDQARKLAVEARVAFHQMSQVRKETALAKVPQVMELVKTSLDNGKLILFCHHREVVEAYTDALNKHFKKQAGRNGTPKTVATVTGQTPNNERQVQADRFQEDENCQVFIGSIGAAGTGLTLTEASTVLFAELDWVPGNMNQAEDRAHRIGQKDHVLVYHTAIENSLESRMVRRLIEKQATIDAALDDGVVPEVETNPTAQMDFAEWLTNIAAAASAEAAEQEDHFSGALDTQPVGINQRLEANLL